MDTIKIKSGNTRIIAHRGLSGIEIENTAAAFVAAGNRASYFGMENDIHRTADGRFVVYHDDTTVNLADVDVEVEKTNFAELRRIQLHHRTEKSRTRGGVMMPSLEEYLEICACYDKVGVVELKSDFTTEELQRIVDICKAYGWLENIVFISFKLECIKRLRALLPEQKIQFLIGERTPELMDVLRQYHFDLDIYYKAMTREWVQELHAEGIEVNVWTVDDAAIAEEMCGWGVDYITSNILEKAD